MVTMSKLVEMVGCDWFAGNNALMRELYETEMPQMTCDDLQHVETAAAIWCHRSRVTVEHLTHELNESSQWAAQGNRDKRHRILRMFLYEVRLRLHHVTTFL